MPEAVSLFSGSLSSSISTEMAIQHSAVNRVVVLTFRSPFFDGYEQVRELARRLWPESQFRSKSIKRETDNIAEFADGSDSPYCTGCRVALLETGKEFLDRTGADFLVSGDTVGSDGEAGPDRLEELDRRAGVEGMVFRPLAGDGGYDFLPNLDSLPDIDGASSDDLMGIARELGLGSENQFISARDRCKLTNSNYRRRLEDLISEDSFNVNDLRLLDFDSYYKIPPNTKVVLGRNSEEKRELHNYFLPRDLRFYLPTREGPMALVRSDLDEESDGKLDELVGLAARITVAKSQVGERDRVPVNYRFEHDSETYRIEVPPLEREKLRELSV